MQQCVTLSAAEAELVAGLECATYMIYVMRLLESIGLNVHKQMLHKMDCKGTVDFANSFLLNGRTRHIEVRMYYLRRLNENKTLRTIWIPGDENPADMFTKNLGGIKFEKHAKNFVHDQF